MHVLSLCLYAAVKRGLGYPVIDNLNSVDVFVCLLYLVFMIKQLQAPRTSRQGLVKGRSHANAVAQQALIAHWQSIVKSLNNSLKIMKANYVSFPFDVCISVVNMILTY